jgi:Sulfotransferase family
LRKLRSRFGWIDTNRTFDSLVYVAGTARSGTTWLAELLNYRRTYRFIFEPFHNDLGPLRGRLDERYRDPCDDDLAFQEATEGILLGKFRDYYTGKYNTKWFSSQRLIKDIHSNLMLKWFREKFPYFPLILIIRHPCAVAHSSTRLGWSHQLPVFLNQRSLVDEHLEPFVEDIASARDDFERFIFHWCIETYVPLRQIDAGDRICVVFFESLARNPQAELDRIFAYIGDEHGSAALDQLARPSATTWHAHSQQTRAVKEARFAWRESLGVDRARRAREILSLFGLDRLYTEDVDPVLVDPVGVVH